MKRLFCYIAILISSCFLSLPLVWGEILTEDQLPATEEMSDVDANEILEAQPVDQYRIETGPALSPAASEYTPITPETLPLGEPYPVATVVPSKTEEAAGGEATFAQHQFFPYISSAYIPELDRTEVNLGLLLHDPPGIEAGISWGATCELMLAAGMTVQSACYTAGVEANYALRNELPAETKPAIAVIGSWRFVNFRTNTEERETIFRGNRILAGVAFSKWMGSLGGALDANESIRNFLNYFKMHVSVLIECQSGRRYAEEEAFTGFEVGARTTLEMMIDPKLLFLTITYDSLPDWFGMENYYLGVRYFARDKFAVDILGGRMGNDLGVTLELAWIF